MNYNFYAIKICIVGHLGKPAQMFTQEYYKKQTVELSNW